jgi:hypothetical protein
MKGSVELKGLEDALRTMERAFPNDAKIQQQLLHGAMGGSARKSLLPFAKQLAQRGDSSGSLSEALKVRVRPKRRRSGVAGGMEITPVRYDKKAIAKYIQHYYAAKGKNIPLGGIDGIRHGHLVEFGTKHHPAYPFLWPATGMSKQYRQLFAGELKKRIESRVRREARKRNTK